MHTCNDGKRDCEQIAESMRVDQWIQRNLAPWTHLNLLTLPQQIVMQILSKVGIPNILVLLQLKNDILDSGGRYEEKRNDSEQRLP